MYARNWTAPAVTVRETVATLSFSLVVTVLAIAQHSAGVLSDPDGTRVPFLSAQAWEWRAQAAIALLLASSAVAVAACRARRWTARLVAIDIGLDLAFVGLITSLALTDDIFERRFFVILADRFGWDRAPRPNPWLVVGAVAVVVVVDVLQLALRSRATARSQHRSPGANPDPAAERGRRRPGSSTPLGVAQRSSCAIGARMTRSGPPGEDLVEQNTFDAALENVKVALERLLHGDAAPVRSLWSTANDITLANPYGPPCRGPLDVGRAIEAAAGQYRGGSRTFEELSRFSTDDLGYVVQVEHTTARSAEDGRSVSFSLRVTMVLRREDGVWQVVHRHADPLTGTRSLTAFASS